MRKIIYDSNNIRVYQDGDKYELFKISARNYDGVYDVSLNLYCTYTDVYCRDWMGRTTTGPQYNPHNEKGYAYKAVMDYVKYFEK